MDSRTTYRLKQQPEIVIEKLDILNQLVSLGGPGSDILYNVLLRSKSNFEDGDHICRLDARKLFTNYICKEIPYFGSIFKTASELNEWKQYDDTVDEVVNFVRGK